ncbi:lysylphosphatidylglycerol synthase transmembrane domain-containing protein [soil metagenome]
MIRVGPWVRPLLTAIFIAGAAAFLAWTAARNWADVQRFEWNVRPLLLAASVVAHVAVLAWGVYVWGRVLRRFGFDAPAYPTLLRIWFGSALARYVPGAIWQFVAAAQLARGAGLAPALLLTSMLVHVGFSLLAAAATAAFTLSHPAMEAFGNLGPMAVLVVAVVSIHPAVIGGMVRIVARVSRRSTLAWQGSWMDGVELFALSLLSWALYGGAFVLFASSVVSLPGGMALPLTGVNALSFLAGYLVVFAPAGLGVREVSMTVLLAGFLPAGVATLLAVASRLWTVVAELVGGALALLWRRTAQ